MIALDKLKIVLFDFDDTLAIWENHAEVNDTDIDYFSNVLVNKVDTWKDCKINYQMKLFMQICKEKGIKLGLISKTCSFQHMLYKQQWVLEKYGYELENYCVSEMSFKTVMLEGIAKAYGYKKDEIAIIDDYFEHTTNAANAGFQAYTPMEIVNFVNELDC